MSTEGAKSGSDELAAFLADLHFICPNFNDSFAYASADSEQISVGDGEVLAAFWREFGWSGLAAIAAEKRQADPLGWVSENDAFERARAALRSGDPVDSEDADWTLRDEFELR